MISHNDLVEEFGEGKPVGSSIQFFQEKMKFFTYNYWVSRSEFRCLLIVSKDTIDHAFCDHVFVAAPRQLSFDKPTIFEFSGSSRDFTHVLAIPSTYHGYLNGVEGVDRRNLLLCIPIYRCEFSGDETADEFKYMHPRLVSIWEWGRQNPQKFVRTSIIQPLGVVLMNLGR